MWPPGSLLHVRKSSNRSVFQVDPPRSVLCTVIACEQVSFGTRGPMYRVMFLSEGQLRHFDVNSPLADKHFMVHWLP